MDGVFDSNTEKAVRQFQKALGLVIDGIVGPATKKALGL
ncbi:peptidoglycan-binding domain-containing protein [Priestia megaterium]|nr:peptidoglycan-binding domain-containing protein [Priestia megaterium]